jgi:hypothetical protein
MEPARIPYDCEHELCRLNCGSFSFGHLSTIRKPDRVVIHSQVEPWLIECHEIMPCVIALDPKRPQELSGQFDPLFLLCLWQSMWNSSKMARREPKWVSEATVHSCRRYMGKARELVHWRERILIEGGQDSLVGIIESPWSLDRSSSLAWMRTMRVMKIAGNHTIYHCIAPQCGHQILMDRTGGEPLKRQVGDNRSLIHFLISLNIQIWRPTRTKTKHSRPIAFESGAENCPDASAWWVSECDDSEVPSLQRSAEILTFRRNTL